jgi:hypothetical protein
VFVGDRSAEDGELHDVMIFIMQSGDYPMLFSASRAVFRGERLYPVSPNLYFFDGRSLTTHCAAPGSRSIFGRSRAARSAASPVGWGWAR